MREFHDFDVILLVDPAYPTKAHTICMTYGILYSDMYPLHGDNLYGFLVQLEQTLIVMLDAA